METTTTTSTSPPKIDLGQENQMDGFDVAIVIGVGLLGLWYLYRKLFGKKKGCATCGDTKSCCVPGDEAKF